MARQKATQQELTLASDGMMYGNNDNGLQIEFPLSFAKQHVFYCSTSQRNGTIKESRIIPIHKAQYEKLTDRKTGVNNFEQQLKTQFGMVEQINIVK
jgi:hypothetical protein